MGSQRRSIRHQPRFSGLQLFAAFCKVHGVHGLAGRLLGVPRGNLQTIASRVIPRLGSASEDIPADARRAPLTEPSTLTKFLRWVRDPRRRDLARALRALGELLENGRAPQDTPETILLLRVALRSGLEKEAFDLVSNCLLRRPAREELRNRLARAALLHIHIDADAIDRAVILRFADAFEPADWTVVLAFGAVSEDPDRVREYDIALRRHLQGLDPIVYAFAAFLTPLRVASTLGGLDVTRAILDYFDLDSLVAIDARALAEYARRFDYGLELATYLDARTDDRISIGSLLKTSLGPAAHHQGPGNELRLKYPPPDAHWRAYAQRLVGWGLTWDCMRAADAHDAFDWRKPESWYWRHMATLAYLADQPTKELELRRFFDLEELPIKRNLESR